MQLLTLATARDFLWEQATLVAKVGASVDEIAAVDRRINLAVERFFTSGNWRGSLERVVITAYDSQITLPRALQTVLGVKSDCSRYLVRPIWHEFIGGSCCLSGYNELTDLGEGFCTFRDIPEALPLLVSANEVTAATLTLTGIVAGASLTVEVDLTDASTTIPNLFTSITRLNKPVTTNSVTISYVDGAEEVLLATMEPGETDANYRRYRVPSTTTTVDAICKRAFIFAVADLDTLVPNNLGALKLMLRGLYYEDLNDLDRGVQYAGQAVALADADRQQFDGDNQTPIYNITRGMGAADMPQLIFY